jgi:hypothetical protein
MVEIAGGGLWLRRLAERGMSPDPARAPRRV